MKVYSTTLLLISTILLLGLSNCTPNPNSELSNSSPTPFREEKNQDTIRVSGGSSTIGVLKLLMDAYTRKVNHTKADFLPSSQSESIIAGVKQGIIEIGSLSKTLEKSEKSEKVEEWIIAQDGLVVATHSSVTGVKNLTTENLKAIYSGQATNWKEFGGPDAKIILLDRPEDESAKRLLREYYLGQDLKNSPEAIVLRKQGELITALQSTPYSIGTFSLANAIYEKIPVNRLSLNGIEPTLANIGSGKYPMVRPIVLVFKKTPTKSVQGFLDFVAGKEGIDLLHQSGYSPSSVVK